jgi:hypothetical protein
VCTSSTRPAGPFEGQVIYETDTNRVLVWDNAAWVMIADTDSPPGLQLIKTQTIGSAVSTVTVSDVFSSEFDNYRILISNVDCGAGSQDMKMTLGSTTTGYYATQEYNLPTTSTSGKIYQNNTAYWGVGFSGATDDACMSIELHGPNLAKRTIVSSLWQGNGYDGSTAGYLSDTTAYTAFTLVPGTTTMTGGTIRVYGYRNS